MENKPSGHNVALAAHVGKVSKHSQRRLILSMVPASRDRARPLSVFWRNALPFHRALEPRHQYPVVSAVKIVTRNRQCQLPIITVPRKCCVRPLTLESCAQSQSGRHCTWTDRATPTGESAGAVVAQATSHTQNSGVSASHSSSMVLSESDLGRSTWPTRSEQTSPCGPTATGSRYLWESKTRMPPHGHPRAPAGHAHARTTESALCCPRVRTYTSFEAASRLSQHSTTTASHGINTHGHYYQLLLRLGVRIRPKYKIRVV